MLRCFGVQIIINRPHFPPNLVSSAWTDGLEGEPAAVVVADFVQVWVAGELDHGRRSAHEDEGVVAGRRQVVPDHVLADEALAVLPVWHTGWIRGQTQTQQKPHVH